MNALGVTSVERLAIAIDADGARHAIYPTAELTLCGTPDEQLVDVVAGDRGPELDCLICATTARLFDRIDCSAPPGWFRDGVAA